MRHFRSGIVDVENLPRALQRFSPTEALHSLEEVNLELLKAAGKTLILLDVDNTLMPWRSEDIPDSTTAWLKKAKAMGFDLCVLSNTRNPERLARICKVMDLDYIRDKFKPSRRMYQLALKKYGVDVEQAVMLGDQLLTDIWGANRTGIDAIWIKPIGPREFIGTRLISRNVERVIGKLLYRYFQAEGADAEVRPGFFRHEIFKQLVKFALVGGTATVVDIGLHGFLMFKAKMGAESVRDLVGTWAIQTFNLGWPLDDRHLSDAAYVPLKIAPVALAIMVSYLLNRVYTFRQGHQKITAKQVGQFYVVAIIGMFISISVGAVVNRLAEMSPLLDWAAGSAVGMIAGFIWNFNGQRLWTFRQK
ncbi:YqeG family HAD IIIA-type phosphatase [Kamptonema cortianum]|nr:YqeG family HAD IIIA-type phosphatase [Geitlerinema splendidum]MDK3157724.1 YqeG family HAD IIIA-type phosphatase [Kamptonema cortianum]